MSRMQESVCDVVLRSSIDYSNYHRILFADDTLSEMLWIHKRSLELWMDVQHDSSITISEADLENSIYSYILLTFEKQNDKKKFSDQTFFLCVGWGWVGGTNRRQYFFL